MVKAHHHMGESKTLICPLLTNDVIVVAMNAKTDSVQKVTTIVWVWRTHFQCFNLFLTLALKKPSKHWGLNQIDGTNQFSSKIYIRLILGILFLGHYSSAKMLYAISSLHYASILFFYGILCRRYIQKLTKWSQKHYFHRNHITILPLFCSIILISR